MRLKGNKSNPHNRQKRNRLCGWIVYSKHKNIDWAFRVFRVKLVKVTFPKYPKYPEYPHSILIVNRHYRKNRYNRIVIGNRCATDRIVM